MRELIDLTHEITGDTLPYPGDPASGLKAVTGIENEGYAVTQLSLCTHTGTHIDAPAHVMPSAGLNEFVLRLFSGHAMFIDCRGYDGMTIDERCLEDLTPCDWLLCCTGHDVQWGKEGYFDKPPVFSEGFVKRARTLASCGIGLDCPGLDADGSTRLHKIFFDGTPKLIVENLTGLDLLKGREIEFFAMPLKTAARDGAPVRAFALAD